MNTRTGNYERDNLFHTWQAVAVKLLFTFQSVLQHFSYDKEKVKIAESRHGILIPETVEKTSNARITSTKYITCNDRLYNRSTVFKQKCSISVKDIYWQAFAKHLGMKTSDILNLIMRARRNSNVIRFFYLKYTSFSPYYFRLLSDFR